MTGAVKTAREQRRQVARDNLKHTAILEPVPRAEWPEALGDSKRVLLLRSRDFLVQVFENEHPDVRVRITVNRTDPRPVLDRWADGISWDELQDIKNQLGYAFNTAVEVFPPANRVVNVANMRHLWVLKEEPGFIWK